MIKNNKLFTAIVAISFVIVALLVSVRYSAAAAGQMYLSPASASVNQNETVTVAVRVNPGTTVTGVTATLGYDSSKLEYVSMDTSGTAFEAALGQQTGGSGKVTINRGTFGGGVSSDSLVTKVTFKALGSSGTAAVSLNGNASMPDGNYSNPGVAGATLTLATPTSTNSGGSTGGSTSGGGTSGGSSSSASGTSSGASAGGSSTKSTKPTTQSGGSSKTSTTPAATGGPAVSVGSQDVQFTTASFTITSAVPVSSYLVYGIDGQLNLQTAPTDFATSHAIALDSATLIAGTTYTYKIVSVDANGNETTSDVQTFQTQGFTLRVKVMGKGSKPVASKAITIHSTPQTAKTDKRGIVTFTNLSAGEHTVEYAVNDKTYATKVIVEDNSRFGSDGKQVADAQNASVTFSTLEVASRTPLYILTLAVLVALAVIAGILIRKKRNNDLSGWGDGSSYMTGYETATLTPASQSVPQTPQVPAPPAQNQQATSSFMGQSVAGNYQPAIFQQDYPDVPAPGVLLQPQDTQTVPAAPAAVERRRF